MNSKDILSKELEKALNDAGVIEQINMRVRRKTSWILLVLSFLALIMVTVSWFTISSLANVEKLEMTIGTAPDLRISTENHGSNWDQYVKTVTSQMIDKELSDRFNTTMNDQVLDPVTSSDGKSFYSQGGTKKECNKNTFLEFDLYLIASKDLPVHLTSDTDGKIKGSSVSTKEVGGKANVIRAVRISFTNEQGKTVIWEPNKGSAVASQSTIDLPKPMSYNNANKICDLKEKVPQKVTVRLWFEGEDPECIDNIQEATMEAILTFGGNGGIS